MAALYGRLQGNRGEATRTGSKASGIKATLETWQGNITVELQEDGTFDVAIGPKSSRGGSIVACGNVNDGKRYLGLQYGDAMRCVHCGWGIIEDTETRIWFHTSGDHHQSRYQECEGFVAGCVATPSLEVGAG